MDAFESLVAILLRNQGYWVHPSYRIELSRAEKRALGKPSMPRPELDLVAYKALRNELLAIECKSFLDSLGVTYSSFVDPSFAGFKRYKIFNDRHYWRVIKASLVRQLVQQEAIHPKPDVVLCLSAGRIRNEKDRQALARLFAKRRWRLYDDSWIAQRVSELATQGYTNNEGVIALKIAKRFS